jgi:hypothetical protein
MKKTKPNINSLSTSRDINVGDMVCYDVFLTDAAFNTPASPSRHGTAPEHGIVVEVGWGSIVKVRPLTNFNAIRLLNVADCRVIKAKEDGKV